MKERKGYRMAKRVNWYFRNWQYQEVEVKEAKKKKKLVYVGEYYSFNLDRRGLLRLKAAYIAATVVLYAIYLSFLLSPSLGNRITYIGGPTMLALVPLIFIGMGVGSLTVAKPDMHYRSYYSSVIRLKRFSLIAAGLIAIGTVGQIVYMIQSSDVIKALSNWWLELWWAVGSVLCIAILVSMWYMLRRFPAKDVIPKTSKSE